MSVALATVLALAGLARAQVTDEGYSVRVEPLPGEATLPAVLPGGVVWFTGTELQHAAAGQPARTLLTYPAFTYGAFTLPVDAATVLFADSGLPGRIWLVPTAPQAAPRLLAQLVLPYDAALVTPGLAVVSAKTGGYGAADNDLLLLDLTTGATTWLGSVPGASGAVAVDDQGGLVYATASPVAPAPPGTVQILRWTATQLTVAQVGAGPLSAGTAQVFASGLDAVGDLVLDGDGDLLFTDWMNEVVGERNDAGAIAANELADYRGSGFAPATLQWLPGTGAFEPFAPGDAELVVWETDYGPPGAATSRLRRVRAQRASIPAAPGPVPAGPMTIDVHGGPASGLGLFAVAPGGGMGALAIAVPGIEQLLHWDQALLGAGLSLRPFDGAGNARLSLHNPGFPGGLPAVVACAFLDATGQVLGSTALAAMQLGN